jgi:hypothetical protein
MSQRQESDDNGSYVMLDKGLSTPEREKSLYEYLKKIRSSKINVMPINEINNKSFLLTLSIEFGLLQKMGLEKANTKSMVPERVMHTIKIINRECIPHLHNIITSIQIPARLNQDQYLNNELGDLQHFVKRLITILQTREVVEDDSLNYMMEEV